MNDDVKDRVVAELTEAVQALLLASIEERSLRRCWPLSAHKRVNSLLIYNFNGCKERFEMELRQLGVNLVCRLIEESGARHKRLALSDTEAALLDTIGRVALDVKAAAAGDGQAVDELREALADAEAAGD